MNKELVKNIPADEQIWHLPSCIDGAHADEMQRHIAHAAQLAGGVTRLVLDLRPLALLDFSGAGFLLDLIAQARARKINVILQTKDESLASLLHFMQFDFVAEIQFVAASEEAVNGKNLK